MLIQTINSNNVWTRFGDMVVDFDNPLKDSANIPANDAALSSVLDIGKRANSFVQATGVNQPIYKHNIINGHNAALFSSNQFLSATHDAAKNGYTGAMTILAIVTTTSIAVGVTRILSKVSGTTDGFSSGRSADKSQFTARGVTDYTDTSVDFAADVWTVITAVYNGSNSVQFYKDGVAQAAIGGGAVNSSTAPLRIGNFNGVVQFWDGYMQLIFWAWRACNAGELAILHEAALTRIGL